MFGYPQKEGIKFSPVSQTEDNKALISDLDGVEALRLPSRTGLSRLYVALLFAVSLLISALLGVWLGSHHFTDLNSICAQKVSQYCRHELVACLSGANLSLSTCRKGRWDKV